MLRSRNLIAMRISARRGCAGRTAAFAVAAALAVGSPSSLVAQGELQGRVVSDSARLPIADAQASIARLGLTARSDSAGRFRLTGLPSGAHQVVVRALGFATDSTIVETAGNEVVASEFALKRSAVRLPGQRITAPEAPFVSAKMATFRDRQKAGIGHFVTRDMLAKAEGGTPTGDVLSKLPGVNVKRGQSKAWIATGRAANAQGRCAFCKEGSTDINPADWAAGARPACYMDVYIDGILVYADNQRPGVPLFDVNTLPPAHIEAMEVYTSAAQVPIQYNRTSSSCGVLLIWTRVG